MLSMEVVRLVIFVGLLGTVYCAAAAILLNSLRRWFLGLPAPSKKRLLARRVVLGIAACGILCIAYGYFIEPYWPEVTHVRLTSAKLSAAAEPIRLVHISDLHCDPKPRLEPRLPALIAQQRPDVILFSGDCINSVQALPLFKQCLAELAAIAPTLVVQGNWDTWRRDVDLFGGTGAVELNGQAVQLQIRDTTLCFAGAAARARDRIESALAAVSSSNFTVFLYHFPDVIDDVAACPVDLCCVGHTHGGQVALPFYGAVITRSKLGKRFEAGLYRLENTWLYVNRGIGMEGKASPRVRFCSRPEVTVIEVSTGKSPATPYNKDSNSLQSGVFRGIQVPRNSRRAR